MENNVTSAPRFAYVGELISLTSAGGRMRPPLHSLLVGQVSLFHGEFAVNVDHIDAAVD